MCAMGVVQTIYNKGWPDFGTQTCFYCNFRSSRDLTTLRHFYPPLLWQRSAAGPLTVTTTASGLLLQNDSAAAASFADATTILAVRSTTRPAWPLQLSSRGRESADDAPGIRKDETGALNSTARMSGTCERAERARHIKLTGGGLRTGDYGAKFTDSSRLALSYFSRPFWTGQSFDQFSTAGRKSCQETCRWSEESSGGKGPLETVRTEALLG